MASFTEPKLETKAETKEYTGKKVRIGIIGMGNIAAQHVKSYRTVPQAEVVAACDIDDEHLDKNCDEWGITKRCASMEEMIANEELDAVDVCVWNCNHAKCTIYALEHGLHVLCEKPMAFNTEEAIAMKEAAERNNKLLMVGFVRRFDDVTNMAKEFVDNGQMGEIYYSKATYLRRHGAPGGCSVINPVRVEVRLSTLVFMLLTLQDILWVALSLYRYMRCLHLLSEPVPSLRILLFGNLKQVNLIAE